LTSSISKAFPEARFQNYNWYIIRVILKFYQGKIQNYTNKEINNNNKKLLST